jgi:hypothetical protein
MDIFDALNPPPIEDHPAFKIALGFKDAIRIDNDVNYDWLYDYSIDTLNRHINLSKEIEDKADSIIKYLGGGTGILTFAALNNLSSLGQRVIYWSIPALLMASLSVLVAAMVRNPFRTYFPPSVLDAYDYALRYKTEEKAKGAMVGALHAVIVSSDWTYEIKSSRLAWATTTFALTIVLLVLPILAVLKIL